MLAMKIEITGNQGVEEKLISSNKRATKAANLAVRSTVKKGRALAKKEILKQVGFPKSYLDGSSAKGKRLDVRIDKFGELERGRIIARRRPTSLATFGARQLYSQADGKKRRAGVSVHLKRTSIIKRAFLMNLKRGSQGAGNQGLAIRVPKGEKPHRKFNGKALYKNRSDDVYLLYGPSVEQVFDDVAPEIAPELSDYLNKEFVRQFDRL